MLINIVATVLIGLVLTTVHFGVNVRIIFPVLLKPVSVISETEDV